jgi:hypothetical protein
MGPSLRRDDEPSRGNYQLECTTSENSKMDEPITLEIFTDYV